MSKLTDESHTLSFWQRPWAAGKADDDRTGAATHHAERAIERPPRRVWQSRLEEGLRRQSLSNQSRDDCLLDAAAAVIERSVAAGAYENAAFDPDAARLG